MGANEDTRLVVTLENIAANLVKVERHLNQATWLLLLIFLAVVGATFAILATAP